MLLEADYKRAAQRLEVEVAVIRAIADVESATLGFLPDGRPVILYEAHVFQRQTKGRFAGAKDRRGVVISSPHWDRKLYGPTGIRQHERLEDAAKLDWDAAHKSASWGLFQILGINHEVIGTVAAFVDAMNESAGRHLDAFIGFIERNSLVKALQARDWDDFARKYNGPGYKQNQYDMKLARAYERWA